MCMVGYKNDKIGSESQAEKIGRFGNNSKAHNYLYNLEIFWLKTYLVNLNILSQFKKSVCVQVYTSMFLSLKSKTDFKIILI